ncbi:hypothetical protein SEA_TEACUP_38 [Arthrobacter phage Teacup]|uniref:Uncharacterized protein n=1 Tax=Arthrobacter phage Teacup TaxID=2015871 RepID=A0A222ZH35_9CAUD|nr:hypothetical protein QCN31_gp38 [Arthrobacter phage Teacup]ASR84043.1 hypothetical protein SEA_TEACUP_38 [Arthrobacter phage Teacup]
METRKSKIKHFLKNNIPFTIAASGAVIAIGATIATKISAPKMVNADGVPQELWDEFMEVAKRMDEAVAKHKAEMKKK